MKKYLFLLVFTFTTIAFSQTESKSFKDKYEEFDYYAKPSPTNNLSKYFGNHIDHVLLESVKYNDTSVRKKRVFLSFALNEENQAINIIVTSPYSELNKNIIEAFKNYDIEKLQIPEKSPLNLYVIQILSYENDKTIINCSTDIIYDRYPVFEGCEAITSFYKMKSCINKQLEAHLIKNISPEVVKKAKILGTLSLKPDFFITEKGTIEKIKCKTQSDSLTQEVIRVISIFPKALTPPTRNGKPTKYYFNGSVRLQIDSDSEKYVADVIKSKDSTLNPNSELAIHFKKFITEEEISKIPFILNLKSIGLKFSFDKKGKMVNIKASSGNLEFNNKLIEIFKKFPFEKLNIKAPNALEIYSYNIITIGYNKKVVIQTNENPNVFIPACFNKNCEKSNSSEELKKCFHENIGAYINSEFDTTIRSKTKLSGEVRIFCRFEIDTDSKIINVKVSAPNPSLANEMEAIIKKLPNVYKPAFSNGVAVKSSYSIPVVFNLGDNIPEDPFKSLNKSNNKATSY